MTMKMLHVKRLKVVSCTEKGARDSRGRFVKAGMRFKEVCKGDKDYDSAEFAMGYVLMGPRFKVNVVAKLKKLRKRAWENLYQTPYSGVIIRRASKPWLSNFNPFEKRRKRCLSK